MPDPTFSRIPAPRPPVETTRSEPELIWASELPSSDKPNGRFDKLYTGWFTPVGENSELDEIMNHLDWKIIYIKHGSGNIVRHYPMEFDMIPLIERVDTLRTIKTDPTRMGMAIGWRTETDGSGQSFCKFLALDVLLLQNGYNTPFLVTVKSRSVQNMVNALLRQYDVLDHMNKLRVASGKEEVQFPFYSISLRMNIGEQETRGTTKTKEYLPFASAVPNPITKEYVLSVYYPSQHPDWVKMIEEQLDEINEWSTEASKQVV